MRKKQMKKTMSNDDNLPLKASNSASTGLTGIHSSIHCPATQDYVEAEYDELDRIAIEHFLRSLAEVALAVAARHRQNPDGDRVES